MKYADETNQKFRIDTPEEIRLSWSGVHRSEIRGNYSRSEFYGVVRAIERAWIHAFGEAPPSSRPQKKHRPRHMSKDFAGDSQSEDVVRRKPGEETLRAPSGEGDQEEDFQDDRLTSPFQGSGEEFDPTPGQGPIHSPNPTRTAKIPEVAGRTEHGKDPFRKGA